MPRQPRNTPAGYVYHVLNRSAGKITLFRRPEDFAAFERILQEAKKRVDLPLLAWCLMKNHWHFVVRPKTDSQLTDFFRWLAHTHAMHWRANRGTAAPGRLYQARFKAFPIQTNTHLLPVCRYVERNARTAGVVKRAEKWRWSSLWIRRNAPPDLRKLLSPSPVKTPADWTQRVNNPLSEKQLARIRLSARRGQPLGDPAWVAATARKLDLQHTLRPAGRPRKIITKKTITKKTNKN